MANHNNNNMLRARELAEMAGVSLPTIKHYVNEGLIPKPLKTGKTMAYYDEACVDRIRLIKKLQKEKFLPLDVIKRALDSGSAYEEELELGQAILKSDRQTSEIPPVSEAQIERHTGFPLGKIRLLEKAGLVSPTATDGAKQYDAIDCRIIEIIKQREELGLPFDHSIETIKAYYDALDKAVSEDIRLFAKNLLGAGSTRRTVKLLTEVDETLDTFVVLARHKLLRSQSRAAIAQMEEIPQQLASLSFLPVEGIALPDAPSDDPAFRILYLFLCGRFNEVISTIDNLSANCQPSFAAAAILAHLLLDDSKTALSLTEQHIPRPTTRMLDNAIATLAYVFSIGEGSGFSTPMYRAKRAQHYLKRSQTARESNPLLRAFSHYVCGAAMTMLPDIFDTHDAGIRILRRLEKSLRAGEIAAPSGTPDWLTKILDHELVPAAEARVNRFLAQAYLRRGDTDNADKHLTRLIEITDPDEEHAQWARLKRIEAKP